MPKIIGILTRHYSKRDMYGNVYDYAEYTDCKTGKNLKFLCDNVDSIRYRLLDMLGVKDKAEIHCTDEQHGQRELFRTTKTLKYVGCGGKTGAKYIIEQLKQ